MGTRRGISIQLVAAIFVLGGAARSQDAPSLGDLARQQRQQREQAAAVQEKNSNASKVITNEEIPEQTEEAPTSSTKNGRGRSSTPSKGAKQSAEFWKSRIQAQKGQIASLKRRIDEINGSIRFSSFDCGANCELRNARQRSKQGQVEQMQGQLEQQTKRLEEMQEAARRQGYGSSVYDP